MLNIPLPRQLQDSSGSTTDPWGYLGVRDPVVDTQGVPRMPRVVLAELAWDAVPVSSSDSPAQV